MRKKSAAVWEVELRLILSRRITLKWGHDPRSLRPLLTFVLIYTEIIASCEFALRLFVTSFPLHVISCRLMHWGYILCSTARLREIRLVGHDYITVVVTVRHIFIDWLWISSAYVEINTWGNYELCPRLSWIPNVSTWLVSDSRIAQCLCLAHIVVGDRLLLYAFFLSLSLSSICTQTNVLL